EIDKFIANSLSPSKVEKVFVNEAEKSALAIVPDYQLSLAIGKEGQNVRLAAKLTGWKIDIKSNLQFEEYLEERNITEEELKEEFENAKKEVSDEEVEEISEDLEKSEEKLEITEINPEESDSHIDENSDMNIEDEESIETNSIDEDVNI
ncbi:MAG: transcription termination/antitermination protein NusA, partial [Peptoniphilus harei]|nr:transcription termination/antitermination protein NusA [Peptoniphilus harei]